MSEENIWPKPGEFAVCTVKKVADFGAFVELEEYAHKEGFIHISEVASGWVKHIRDHVKEEQKVVCKVLYVDAQKRHIDISLKDVNEHQRRAKIQEWKNELKAEKWLTFFTQQHTLTDEGSPKLEVSSKRHLDCSTWHLRRLLSRVQRHWWRLASPRSMHRA